MNSLFGSLNEFTAPHSSLHRGNPPDPPDPGNQGQDPLNVKRARRVSDIPSGRLNSVRERKEAH